MKLNYNFKSTAETVTGQWGDAWLIQTCFCPHLAADVANLLFNTLLLLKIKDK